MIFFSKLDTKLYSDYHKGVLFLQNDNYLFRRRFYKFNYKSQNYFLDDKFNALLRKTSINKRELQASEVTYFH